MDIQSLSVDMSQSRVQEEATVKVQVMAMKAAMDTSADLIQLMDSAQIISDPAKGNIIDMLM